MFRCLHQLKNPTPSMDDKSWMLYKETPPQVNHPSLMPWHPTTTTTTTKITCNRKDHVQIGEGAGKRVSG